MADMARANTAKAEPACLCLFGVQHGFFLVLWALPVFKPQACFLPARGARFRCNQVRPAQALYCCGSVLGYLPFGMELLICHESVISP
jgi:hypothetical protein